MKGQEFDKPDIDNKLFIKSKYINNNLKREGGWWGGVGEGNIRPDLRCLNNRDFFAFRAAGIMDIMDF